MHIPIDRLRKVIREQKALAMEEFEHMVDCSACLENVRNVVRDFSKAPVNEPDGGFMMADETLLQNLKREPFLQLHSGCAEDISD
jgi:hypothetical protein